MHVIVSCRPERRTQTCPFLVYGKQHILVIRRQLEHALIIKIPKWYALDADFDIYIKKNKYKMFCLKDHNTTYFPPAILHFGFFGFVLINWFVFFQWLPIGRKKTKKLYCLGPTFFGCGVNLSNTRVFASFGRWALDQCTSSPNKVDLLDVTLVCDCEDD